MFSWLLLPVRHSHDAAWQILFKALPSIPCRQESWWVTVVVGLRGALSRHLHVTVPADAAKSRSRAISSHRQQTYAGLKIKVAEEHLRMSFWFWSFASFARYLVFAADSTGIVQFQNGGYSSRQRSRELGAAGIVHAEVLYRPFSCFYDSHEFLSLHPSPRDVCRPLCVSLDTFWVCRSWQMKPTNLGM